MPAPISVVIPTLDAARDLPETLAALMPGLSEGLFREVIFADGGSRDGTLAIAEEVGAELVSGPQGEGERLRLAVEAARGDWLLVLGADSHLRGDWGRALARHMAEHPDMAGYFRLRMRARGLRPALAAAWSNGRARVLGRPGVSHGLFLCRAVYAAAGGFSDGSGHEGGVFARVLKGRLVQLDGWAETSAQRRA